MTRHKERGRGTQYDSQTFVTFKCVGRSQYKFKAVKHIADLYATSYNTSGTERLSCALYKGLKIKQCRFKSDRIRRV